MADQAPSHHRNRPWEARESGKAPRGKALEQILADNQLWRGKKRPNFLAESDKKISHLKQAFELLLVGFG